MQATTLLYFALILACILIYQNFTRLYVKDLPLHLGVHIYSVQCIITCVAKHVVSFEASRYKLVICLFGEIRMCTHCSAHYSTHFIHFSIHRYTITHLVNVVVFITQQERTLLFICTCMPNCLKTFIIRTS